MMEGGRGEVVWGDEGGVDLELEDKTTMGFLFLGLGGGMAFLGKARWFGGGWHDRLMVFRETTLGGGKRASGWRWWDLNNLGYE